MQTYETIQFQIGAWSIQNFGRQETPYLTVVDAGNIKANKPRQKSDEPSYDERKYQGNVVVALDSLAPLMGIMEEVGELVEALENENKVCVADALGDIAVYLCDYCCREDIMFPARVHFGPTGRYANAVSGMVAYLGKLYRCHLKRHQRIRNMHDPVVFAAARTAALWGFVWHLEEEARASGNSLLMYLNEAWSNIVKKRDWRTDAAAGGGHSHQGGSTPGDPLVLGGEMDVYNYDNEQDI